MGTDIIIITYKSFKEKMRLIKSKEFKNYRHEELANNILMFSKRVAIN